MLAPCPGPLDPGLFPRPGPLPPVWVLLFGLGPELGLRAPSRGAYPWLLLRESLLPLPDHERGSGFLLVSGLPEIAPGAGLPTRALVAGRLDVDLVEGPVLLYFRGPYPDIAPGPLLSGALFLVLGQGRWSGFRLISGFPMAAPVAGLPVTAFIVVRLVAGRDVGRYVLSPRGLKPSALPGSLLPVKALLYGRGPEAGLCPASLAS